MPAWLYSLVVAVRIVETTGPGETESLGAELAGSLREGDVVLLQGELGTGKTTLVRGAARALGVTDPVTSPSFSIGQRDRGVLCSVTRVGRSRWHAPAHEYPALHCEYLGVCGISFVE